MGLGSILFIALGLSMDAFAVSISSGARTRHRLLQNALLIALFFGAFQAIMPAVGWAAGCSFASLISQYDHWIAFGLLSALGGKMIYETLKDDEEESDGEGVLSLTLSLLLALSVATSLDALAVGVSFACINASILVPVLIIGVVTFLLSMAGVVLGHRCGNAFGKKFEVVGGLILIGIGLKILISHLC